MLGKGSYGSNNNGVSVTKTMEDTLQENRFFTIIAGGDNKLYNADVTYKAAYSQATQDQPFYNKYTFNNLPNSIQGNLIYNDHANVEHSPKTDLTQFTRQNHHHNYMFNNLINQSFYSDGN